MSYGILTPCYNCDKKDTCTDAKDIADALLVIHSKNKETGHQGSGTVVLMCAVQNKV